MVEKDYMTGLREDYGERAKGLSDSELIELDDQAHNAFISKGEIESAERHMEEYGCHPLEGRKFGQHGGDLGF